MNSTNKKSKGDNSISLTGQIVDIEIESLDEEGAGTGQIQGKKIKVGGVLPGEHVRVKILHTTRQLHIGIPVKILRHSPERLISPPCTIVECDGCPLKMMKYPAQLSWKSESLMGELRRYFPPDQLNVRPIIPSPKTTGYRNSAKLVVAGKHNKPVIGIYRKNSHDVVDISECPLHHPLINRVVDAVREGIRKGKVPIFSARSGSGLLRYLAVRVSEHTGQAMVTFVTAERSYNEIHHLAKHLLAAVPEVSVIVQNINSSAGNVILGQKDHFMTPGKSLTDTIGTIRFCISPRSFFQVNNGGARIIYEQVREFAELSGRERVLDLYCGVGGISFFLAGSAKEVLGIESVPSAVADAEVNAALNGITNCRFIAGDALSLLGDLDVEGKKPDVIVLNPPRKGCETKVLQQVAHLGPERMIYVSCSPRSLANDLSILFAARYVPLLIQPIDMFPQTPHMETVVLLGKKP